MPPPRFKIGYVSLPVHQNYWIGFIDAIGDEGRESSTDGVHPLEATYSPADIKSILANDGVQRDQPRIHWALNKVGSQPYSTIEDMVQKSKTKEANLGLSLQEAEALYAFACSARSEKYKYDLYLAKPVTTSRLKELDLSQYRERYFFVEDENKLVYVTNDIKPRIEDINISEHKGHYFFAKDINKLIYITNDPEPQVEEIAIHNVEAFAETLLGINPKLKANFLYLSDDEIGKLITSNTKHIPEERPLKPLHLQSGLFKFPIEAIAILFSQLDRSGVFFTNLDNCELRVTRADHNKINVSFDMIAGPRCEVPKGEVVCDEPLLLYSNRYEIVQKEGNFTCTRMEDVGDNGILFIKTEFFNHLIAIAKDKLKAVDFAVKLNKDLRDDLLFFIPLLSNNEFAELFAEKLHESAINPDTINFLSHHMKLCFGEPTFWQKNQSKIIFCLVCLLLIAAAIGVSIATFGIPAILAVTGGAVGFGVATALFGPALITLSGIIGNYFDDKRMLPFKLIEDMEQTSSTLKKSNITEDRPVEEVDPNLSSSHDEKSLLDESSRYSPSLLLSESATNVPVPKLDDKGEPISPPPPPRPSSTGE